MPLSTRPSACTWAPRLGPRSRRLRALSPARGSDRRSRYASDRVAARWYRPRCVAAYRPSKGKEAYGPHSTTRSEWTTSMIACLASRVCFAPQPSVCAEPIPTRTCEPDATSPAADHGGRPGCVAPPSNSGYFVAPPSPETPRFRQMPMLVSASSSKRTSVDDRKWGRVEVRPPLC